MTCARGSSSTSRRTSSSESEKRRVERRERSIKSTAAILKTRRRLNLLLFLPKPHSPTTTTTSPHLSSAEKAMFVVEQAHWYFEDFCRDANPLLPSLSLRSFAHALAAHCPDAFSSAFGIRGQHMQTGALIHDIDAAMAQFNAFKARVPTAGAALLDPTLTKVLMVKGYKKDASWGFPRGKLSKGETASECAAREVLEETGIDISGFVDETSSPRIEVDVSSQQTTLFIVAGAASEETPVAALVRGEIGDIAWHLLADLPSTREAGMLTYKTAAGVKHRFWRVRVVLEKFFFVSFPGVGRHRR